MVIDDISYFRERARRHVRVLSEAFVIQREDGYEAAVRFLVGNGYHERDAREVLYVAKDPAKAAGRI